MPTEKDVICFIDDDQHELDRFESAFSPFFTCVTGKGYEDCRTKLAARKLKPKLWVLDLYFPAGGKTNSKAEIEKMNSMYGNLEQETREFKAYLASIGQGADGGLSLLQTCRENHNVPVVMFTRKGTLDDAIRCLDAGAAAVLKKPMPHALAADADENKLLFDEALSTNTQYLRDKMKLIIEQNDFWHRSKGFFLFVIGAVAAATIEEAYRNIGLFEHIFGKGP